MTPSPNHQPLDIGSFPYIIGVYKDVEVKGIGEEDEAEVLTKEEEDIGGAGRVQS